MLSRCHVAAAALLVLTECLALPPGVRAQSPGSCSLKSADFSVTCDARGVTGISSPSDRFGAQLLSPGGHLGLVGKYRVEHGDWLDLYQDGPKVETSASEVRYANDVEGTVLSSSQSFRLAGNAFEWSIDIANRMTYPVEVGDLAIALPWRAPSGENPDAIFERSWTKHQFISGYGSFIAFVRPNGEPPFLLVTPLAGTKLEYYGSPGGRGNGFLAYIHSALTGGSETRGTWRQPHTALRLPASGQAGSRVRYGFRFQWVNSYDAMRQALVDAGVFDIRVIPGMTVPEDLDARMAIRTRARIEAIKPEFPEMTRIEEETGHDGYRLFRVHLGRLGENRLTIVHDGGRETYLEFFVTEPVETLIRKRAHFLVTRQQHRDPAKWYDGLFSVYDMRAKTLRSPDDTDGFDYWWGYVVAADDPVLGKAPFIASKNLRFPDASEIAAIEYYLEHFVWGKLQRTDQERPYPYGMHGVPNWREARDPALRARSSNNNLDRMKIWRSYDYPHMVMLYFHLFQVAERYPSMVHYLDAAGYLERAYQTARAYFTYPYEILPWYETYKWGCYNELLIPDLVKALERRGRATDAAWLRAEWEKKVKYFVYDDKYPFRSEYAIDRTAFESSYALARYGATTDMAPDQNLWYDKSQQRWYSHPSVSRPDSRAFMERQHLAGLAVRGWVEPAYYLLGADFTGSSDSGSLSYMANMGGWAILDYALNFSSSPWDWIELGYASYLSSWALMNTGRPETNYGFWFPGPENDGASGWQFMTAKFGRAWIRKEVPRGPWHYDGEIDLGYGGGLRMAATVVADDPVFGTAAFGGSLTAAGPTLSVVPRDGVRQRFSAVLRSDGTAAGQPRRARLELDRDGFAAGAPIVFDHDLRSFSFTLENRTGDTHRTVLRLSLPKGTWQVRVDNRTMPVRSTGDWEYPLQADLAVTTQTRTVRVTRE